MLSYSKVLRHAYGLFEALDKAQAMRLFFRFKALGYGRKQQTWGEDNMADVDDFLVEAQDTLTEVLKPYQQELTRRERMAEFIKRCIQFAGRNDFLQLDELLKTSMAQEIEAEESLGGCKDVFDRLRAYADDMVERYRIQFVEHLAERAQEAGLEVEIDFPRFSVLKGIDGTVDFSARRTVINKKVLKSIDPRRIVSMLLRIKRELYDGPYDPQTFIANLYRTYSDIIKNEKWAPGHPVPIQKFYFDHVISLQSKSFFQDMEKGKFRGYSLDQFAVDMWRFFQAGTGGTSDGHVLQLRPGRSNFLWLIDSEGQRRQIATIAFQEHK